MSFMSIIEQTRLQASNPTEYDYFGCSVALSADGNTLAIGAHMDNNSIGQKVGSVYIFTKSSNTWVEQARLQASDAAEYDWFGKSITLSADGNTLAIGACLDTNSGGTNAGSVYIFTRSGSVWAEQARLQASDAEENDYFGCSVALSSDGHTLAIGAHADDNSAGTNAGSVYIFTKNRSTWVEQARLQASDAFAGDQFGGDVAISADGNILAVGVQYDDNSNGTYAGSVYIFTRTGSVWTEQARLQASNSVSSTLFGCSVALSSDGNTLSVGAYADDNLDHANAGAVYIFTKNGSTWTEQARLCASDAEADDWFGTAIALSSDGNILAVGAYVDDNSYGKEAGSVYIFTRSGTTWSQQTSLQASDAVANDWFGSSVTMNADGSMLAVGSFANTLGKARSGAVYIFGQK